IWTALEGNGVSAHAAPDATIAAAQTALRDHRLKNKMLQNEQSKSLTSCFFHLMARLYCGRLVAVCRSRQR
ncbi:MAG: hypothetical protein WAM83_16595, partial [Bradyrhizobium sp.]